MGMPVLRMFRFWDAVVLLYSAIVSGVVLIVVDLPAGVVLLTVHLGTLLLGEFAAVGRAIIVNLPVDIRLALFVAGGFTRSKLPGLYAVGDARLLVCFTSIHTADRSRCRPAMIF